MRYASASLRHEAAAPGKYPVNLDLRETVPECVGPVRDQQKCGSCWAFASVEAVGDRVCIATNGTDAPILSPLDLIAWTRLAAQVKKELVLAVGSPAEYIHVGRTDVEE